MSLELIHVEEAKRLIREYTSPLSPRKMDLTDAAGLTLAEHVYSKTDLPPFHQSSMDGYALNYASWQRNAKLKVEGIIPAGSDVPAFLNPQQAMRIFTGAVLPSGADTVVMQEKVSIQSGELIIEDTGLHAGSNVRAQGSEIRSGELALEKNTILTPASLGFLAGMGISEVSAFPRPSVSIILTGDELCKPGQKLAYGQVYEANSYALLAALKQIHIDRIKIYSAEDKLETLSAVLQEALDTSDVVLLTGGVSVGDYDFVIRAASANNVSQVFHKIRQKPGKPFYFGKKGLQTIFGLPGNPASVLSCFYLYVLPALGYLANQRTELQNLLAPLQGTIRKPRTLTQLLKGAYKDGWASQLNAQESFRLSSFAHASCLIELEEEKTEFNEGDLVRIHLLPC